MVRVLIFDDLMSDCLFVQHPRQKIFFRDSNINEILEENFQKKLNYVFLPKLNRNY